ncbi:MAG TPA: alpha-amylase [Porticoccaceae bacterium]|nr:alpha-amylase [Porticoccaceae bacterium]
MDTMTDPSPMVELRFRIINHLSHLYPNTDVDSLCDEVIAIMGFKSDYHPSHPFENHWDERDIAVITYADTIVETGVKPLHSLKDFFCQHLSDIASIVHVLPFYPFSSDDGFAVVDYLQVEERLGTWQDIGELTRHFKLMADLVINHCSSQSQWFLNFLEDMEPGRDYFVTVGLEDDLSQVVRPRTSPLLKKVETAAGERHVWCTFSHDQVDLDFANPRVLLEFIKIVAFYLRSGVDIFRLDAIAFVWKIIGTDCLNLPQTHEIVRLLRTLVEHTNPDALLITETNIPNRENLSYFGNANEAHIIYNFSLPPLLVNTLITGDCQYLRTWMMSMPPARNGTTYLNFIASHDGLGLRPAEGLLSDEEILVLAETLQKFGGHISWRALNHNSPEARPYEINISLYDALQGTVKGSDSYNHERFLCAHAIMLALEGIPAFYFHSLVATHNDNEKLQRTGHNRAINRHNWDRALLEQQLNNGSEHQRVFEALTRLIKIRKANPCFHPNATQFTLHLPGTDNLNRIFAFWRQSIDRQQNVFCLYNVTDQAQTISLCDLNLINTDDWFDLVTGSEHADLQAKVHLAPYEFIWLANTAA